MARSLYRDTILLRGPGGLIPLAGAQVWFYEPNGAGVPGPAIAYPLFPDAHSTDQLPVPYVTGALGELEVWADAPHRAQIVAVKPGFAQVTETIDLEYPPELSASNEDIANAILAHEAKEDPHDQYLTPDEGDLRYLPIGTVIPVPIDAYTKGESDARYLPVSYVPPPPDLSAYSTTAQANALYEPLDSAYTKSESDARYLPSSYVPPATDVTIGVNGSMTVTESPANTFALAVLLSPDAGNALALRANGLFGTDTGGGGGVDSYTKAESDARYATPASVATAVAAYLPLVGGTLTGALILQGAAAATNVLQAKVTGDANPRFRIDAKGNLEWTSSVSGSVLASLLYGSADLRTGCDFAPNANSAYRLGQPALLWQNVYSSAFISSNTGYIEMGSTLTAGSSSTIRLRNAALIGWRNAGNTNNLTLGVDASDNLASSTTVVPTTNNALDLGLTGTRWRKLWAVDAEFTNAPTVGGVALPTSPGIAAAYVPLAGGSVLTGNLGPTTDVTRDLGASALRWRIVYGRDANFTTYLGVGSSSLWASTGSVRLPNAGLVAWRNAANDGNFTLTVDASDNLLYNGTLFRIGSGGPLLQYTGPGALRVDNYLGVGVTPAAFGTGWRAVQIGDAAAVWGQVGGRNALLVSNSYQDAVGPKAIQTGLAARVQVFDGGFAVATAPSVAAGAAQTFTTRMMVDQAGNLGVGVIPAVGWTADRRAVQFGEAASLYALASGVGGGIQSNSYWDGANKAVVTGGATIISIGPGNTTFYTAPSVAAGAAQTFTARMTLDVNGGLVLTTPVGTTGLTVMTPAVAAQIAAFFNCGAGLWIDADSANFPRIRVASNLYLQPANSGIVGPATDNQAYCGGGSNRWIAVYAVNGAIQSSTADMKQDFSPLDPAACVEAVLTTDWLSFSYLPPAYQEQEPTPLLAYDASDSNEIKAEKKAARDEAEAQSKLAYAKMLVETQPVRDQKGYVLQSTEYQVSDLFGLSDRKGASPSSDLAVVACALQDALRRIAVLEGAAA